MTNTNIDSFENRSEVALIAAHCLRRQTTRESRDPFRAHVAAGAPRRAASATGPLSNAQGPALELGASQGGPGLHSRRRRMVNAEYSRIPFQTGYGVSVNGAISVGDRVRVPRPNGTNHYHVIQEVIWQRDSIRLCSVVPVTSDRIKEVFYAD